MSKVDLVRKLLKLSANAGSEQEAALAADRARAIMHEYQITEAELRLNEAAEARSVEEIIKGKVTDTRRRVAWHMDLACGVGGMFGCRAYWHGGKVMFFGRLSMVQAATYTTQYLINEVEQLCDADAPARIYDRSYRNAFRLGCAGRLRTRMERETDACKRAEERERKAVIAERERAKTPPEPIPNIFDDTPVGDALDAAERDRIARCPCAISMHCLCAGHARGNDPDAPCDTSEQPVDRLIENGPAFEQINAGKLGLVDKPPRASDGVLAVIAKDQAEVDEKYQDFMYPKKKNGKRKKKRGISIGQYSSSDGFYAGKEAASKIKTNTVARAGLPRGQGSLK